MIENLENRLFELEREMAALPPGSITVKTISGKPYYYHRVMVEGKRKENYVDPQSAAQLKEQIARRKELEIEYRHLHRQQKELEKQRKRQEGSYEWKPSLRSRPLGTAEAGPAYMADHFRTYIRAGEALERFVAPVRDFKKRACFAQLQDFLHDTNMEKVLILYGLRRTGKTTMIRQAIGEMERETLEKTVFLQVKSSDTMADVNADLRRLESAGYRYVFLDEVTLMWDFVEGAALFSDIFAASGMKIVLSGTDSLGFLFSEDQQLFDRCKMIHTTFIPYREFEEVLGRRGIDEYIRYGGTMSPSGIDYNREDIFATAKRANEYVDSAIATNIQHSLQRYQGGGHFRGLKDLYEKGELTGAINRVVEDMNHRFTMETLTRAFRSNDLAVSAANLRRDKKDPTDILDRVDRQMVTEHLKKALEILDREEQKVAVDQAHAAQIWEYMALLDLVEEIEVVHLPITGKKETIDVITQPGLRYVQAEALVDGLMRDRTFGALSITARSRVTERIRGEIMGRMMEEILLLETKLARPGSRVFQLQFAVGEFDMVVADPTTLTCRLYEIKHSDQVAPEQTRHLIDEKKCAAAEYHFGKILGKHVIYRGPAMRQGEIEYLNVEEYLKSL